MDRGLMDGGLEMASSRGEPASAFDIEPLETGEFESGPVTPRSSRAREQYVDTSTWQDDPLRGHGGTGANLLLRWNNVPADAQSIDVVVHLHGHISQDPDARMLREVSGRSGLDLAGRQRPTLAIVPRGRRITKEEVKKKQALLAEQARREGKTPRQVSAAAYTFPALWRGDGAGLAALINAALQWFARNTLGRDKGAPLPIARLIFTAHSGGGAALDRLVASHARCKACNPDEVHAFDALYGAPAGLRSWAAARLRADRSRAGGLMDAAGGGLRVFYRTGAGGTQRLSESLGRSLPPRGDPLARYYRVEHTQVAHLAIPNTFGPALLRDRTADAASRQPLPGGARSPRVAPPGARPARPGGSDHPSCKPATPERALLPNDVPAWIHSTTRSAIELVADEAQRRRFLQQIDWSREYFKGNLDAQKRLAPGHLSETLFYAMARVTPELRVSSCMDNRPDIASIVVPIPGVPGKKLHPEAAEAFVRLREAAAKDGIAIRVLPGPVAAFRSAGEQEALGQKQRNRNAVGGNKSAHLYGLAVDLQLGVPGLKVAEASTHTPEKMANIVRMYRSPNYKWLVLNASRFGWFPYRKEPWHWEYNPPGFAARFEANQPVRIEREFGGPPRERRPAQSPWGHGSIPIDQQTIVHAMSCHCPNCCASRSNEFEAFELEMAPLEFEFDDNAGFRALNGETPGGDPAIESLNLAATARRAAYLIKKKHPWVRFTSGRRDPARQASAMAGNVVENRKWIRQTYSANPVSRAAQAWVDEHPEARTKKAIGAGLLDVFRSFSPADLGRLSSHLSGRAFDISPVPSQLAAISATIKSLPRLKQFLTREGGLERWHVAFA